MNQEPINISEHTFNLRLALIDICEIIQYIWSSESPFITFDFVEGKSSVW